MIIVGIIIILILLYGMGEILTEMKNLLKPISEYYYKKQRNQLNEKVSDVDE